MVANTDTAGHMCPQSALILNQSQLLSQATHENIPAQILTSTHAESTHKERAG